jgi:hypothetical protein
VAAEVSDAKAFVRISPRDSRYFELTNGQAYIPIGLNIVGPPRGDWAAMEEWFQKLSAHGGNFVRVWLGSSYFDVEHARSGQYDPQRAERIDTLLAAARKHGIRLKLCLESFRHLGEGKKPVFAKPLHHVSQGGPANNTAEFFDSLRCREQFQGKLAWFAQRYGSEPIVFGWELWNEMDCIQAGDWKAWTTVMLPELHRLFPQNLAVQSLGSYDSISKRKRYQELCRLEGNDVLQVHRYLDLGAALDTCHGPVDLLAADAVGELLSYGVRKPVLLAESGAVEPQHTGPLKLYDKDRAGMILHDVLFAPFFSGAAGPGHIWHWDVYVDRQDLWRHFGRFAKAVQGIDPPAEAFQPRRLEHPRLRVLVLQGRRTLLAWCRDPQNTWQSELAEDRPPEVIRGAAVDLGVPADWQAGVNVSIYDPWTDRQTVATLQGGRVMLREFSRSIVIRLQRP